MNTVLNNQGHTELPLKMKKYLVEGLAVPDELAIQCLMVALMHSTCSTKGYQSTFVNCGLNSPFQSTLIYSENPFGRHSCFLVFQVRLG